MSMMWPPHSVKIVSTPSFFSARATRCPPEITSALRDFCLSVSSAVPAVGRVSMTVDIALLCTKHGRGGSEQHVLCQPSRFPRRDVGQDYDRSPCPGPLITVKN